MVEKIALNVLVGRQFGRIGIAVYLEWNSVLRWIQLPYQTGHILPNVGIALQIILHVLTQHTDIGKMAAVNGIHLVDTCLRIVFLNLFRPRIDIILQQFELGESIQHLLVAKTHCTDIYKQRALDAPHSRI